MNRERNIGGNELREEKKERGLVSTASEAPPRRTIMRGCNCGFRLSIASCTGACCHTINLQQNKNILFDAKFGRCGGVPSGSCLLVL
jgi:hypothetical protein